MAPDTNERRPLATDGAQENHDTASVADGQVNPAIAEKLWRLHWRYGYFTESDILGAVGHDRPQRHGTWECPGEFGSSGRWKPHCKAAAS